MDRQFGWKKDIRDERDFLHATRKAVLLPDEVDLKNLAPVVDQGNEGSCVGQGIGGKLTSTAIRLGVDPEWFSRRYIYNGARAYGGYLNEEGAYPRDGYEFLLKWKVLKEHAWPYKDNHDNTDPRTRTWEPADLWVLDSYVRCVDGIGGIQSALADGHFVSIGASWYDSWSDTDRDGVLPADYSSVAGGHEFYSFGYSIPRQLLFCVNSWGKNWGKGGIFYVPFSAVEAWKKDDGYDAHYGNVSWSGVIPEPVPGKKFPWWWVLLGAAGLGGLAWGVKSCN